jgi:hypothetical protein
MARRKLGKIRDIKNQAAFKIQRNWRKKLLLWVALLRCIYRQPIIILHNAATTIQRKWRHWHMFRNSPLASKYHRKVQGTVLLIRSRESSKYDYTMVATIIFTIKGNPSQASKDTSSNSNSKNIPWISITSSVETRCKKKIIPIGRKVGQSQEIPAELDSSVYNSKSMEKLGKETYTFTKGKDKASRFNQNTSVMERILV